MKSVDKTETNQPTTPKESPNFYERTLRNRAIDFLYRHKQNDKDENQIKKIMEIIRKIDIRKGE
jgi:hypothetical protein